MHVDGASSVNGSGAGIVLESPEGETIEHSLRSEFPSSNNIAEYEALIAGMKLAEKLQVRSSTAFSDSQLVVNQYNGQFETREPSLVPYQ